MSTEEIKIDPLQDFINYEFESLKLESFSINSDLEKVRGAAGQLHRKLCNIRQRTRKMLNLGNITQDQRNYLSQIYDHTNRLIEDEEDSIEKLLNFSTEGKGGRSYLLDEVYDHIGKDAARSLKSRLRDVIRKIDPAKAESFL